jgi:hypothetical protein
MAARIGRSSIIVPIHRFMMFILKTSSMAALSVDRLSPLPTGAEGQFSHPMMAAIHGRMLNRNCHGFSAYDL